MLFGLCRKLLSPSAADPLCVPGFRVRLVVKERDGARRRARRTVWGGPAQRGAAATGRSRSAERGPGPGQGEGPDRPGCARWRGLCVEVARGPARGPLTHRPRLPVLCEERQEQQKQRQVVELLVEEQEEKEQQ